MKADSTFHCALLCSQWRQILMMIQEGTRNYNLAKVKHFYRNISIFRSQTYFPVKIIKFDKRIYQLYHFLNWFIFCKLFYRRKIKEMYWGQNYCSTLFTPDWFSLMLFHPLRPLPVMTVSALVECSIDFVAVQFCFDCPFHGLLIWKGLSYR